MSDIADAPKEIWFEPIDGDATEYEPIGNYVRYIRADISERDIQTWQENYSTMFAKDKELKQRIAELEARLKYWHQFIPFLAVHGMLEIDGILVDEEDER